MKKLFITSMLGCEEKTNGIKLSKPINNENKVIELMKDNLDEENTFVFVCSNPDTYEINDFYANITFESFNKSGFNFQNLIIVDHRYKGPLEEDIYKSDLVMLSGGNTLTEMRYFEEINLRNILKNYDKVIVGQSAGALNLANVVVCAPEYIEEIGTSYTWSGLELTNINIEPHFVTQELTNSIDILLREELLKLSEEYLIYALIDGSYIFDDGTTQILYGEGYLIYKRKIKKICNKKEKIILKR